MLDNTSQEFLRALEFHKAGRLDDAEDAYLVLLQRSPDHSSALHNMGVVLAQKRKQIEAIFYFDRAIAALPDYAEAYNNRGSALLALGRLDQALHSYNQSLEINPDYWEASLNLANVFMRLNRYQDALNIYSGVLEIAPENYRAKFNSGLACFALGNLDDACNYFLQTMAIRKSEINSGYERELDCFATKSKLQHDAEQFRYLSKVSFSDLNFNELADGYEKLVTEIDWNKASEKIVKLTDLKQPQITRTYNSPFHLVDLSKLEGGVINQRLNTGEITEQFSKSKPNHVFFDNFLSKDTLDQLRNFLLESIIWHDFRHIDGFLAAYLENGLATPLLLQIAHDVKLAFPEILGKLPLTQVWAFKKLQGDGSIDLHADSGEVSLNFWLTPDEANLDPAHGGMVIYGNVPPRDWRLREYSGDVKRIQSFLSRSKGKIIRIPYQENRAVLFKSELFHKSDLVKFKPGYKNHRINITMIFGFGHLS